MVSIKEVGLYVGVLGALASVGSFLLPSKAPSQSSSGENSPVISGNGNSVTYQNGFPTLESIKAQRPDISDQQYDAIKVGMTYPEVLSIVKIPGKENTSGRGVQVYTWGTEMWVYMMVTFVNGKVHSKSH